jgi:hypothetical protein
VNCDFADTNGDTVAHFRVTQSGVSNSFIMLVPIYLQLENGTTARIANLTLHGDAVIDHTMNLGKLPSPAKKLLVNYNADVLSD